MMVDCVLHIASINQFLHNYSMTSIITHKGVASLTHNIKLSFSHATFDTTIVITITGNNITHVLPIVLSKSGKFFELYHENQIYVESLDVFKTSAQLIAKHERFKIFFYENEAFDGGIEQDELQSVFMKIHEDLQKVLDYAH